jgi:hypothetical protein
MVEVGDKGAKLALDVLNAAGKLTALVDEARYGVRMV